MRSSVAGEAVAGGVKRSVDGPETYLVSLHGAHGNNLRAARRRQEPNGR